MDGWMDDGRYEARLPPIKTTAQWIKAGRKATNCVCVRARVCGMKPFGQNKFLEELSVFYNLITMLKV